MKKTLSELLAALVKAMESSVENGCTDHLDCWDEAYKIWHDPLKEAKEALRDQD